MNLSVDRQVGVTNMESVRSDTSIKAICGCMCTDQFNHQNAAEN